MTDVYLILGFGVTGKALAGFFERKGSPYLVAEDNFAADVPGNFFRGRAEIRGDTLFCRGEEVPPSSVKGFLPSPGVSPAHPIARWSMQHAVPLVSELDLAAENLHGEFIGVTGTNGKSTTVKLIGALLQGAGFKAGFFGNIGSPLVNAVSETPQDFYVIEESSYQLEQIRSLKHRFAACLNVTDDHFDRHGDLNSYAAAKERVLLNSGPEDVFVYNADDPRCVRMATRTRAQLLPFSLVNRFASGGFMDGDELVVALPAGTWRFPLKAAALKGLHNAENMLVALLIALSARHDEAAVASYRVKLASFQGLPHRVEKVFSQGGVDYYDDSKGTNVGAVVMSLAGFEGNVILIAGGKDKLGDYAPLKGLVKAKVKKLVLIGEAKERMKEAFSAVTDVVLAADMKDAVAIAKKAARSGDTVLLSPACASFDQYGNYKERGLDFQKWVKES